MDYLAYFESVTLRSLVLFAVAAGAIFVLRVKSAAARHAVWTVVLPGCWRWRSSRRCSRLYGSPS